MKTKTRRSSKPAAIVAAYVRTKPVATSALCVGDLVRHYGATFRVVSIAPAVGHHVAGVLRARTELVDLGSFPRSYLDTDGGYVLQGNDLATWTVVVA